jgi:hypothetical protein
MVLLMPAERSIGGSAPESMGGHNPKLCSTPTRRVQPAGESETVLFAPGAPRLRMTLYELWTHESSSRYRVVWIGARRRFTYHQNLYGKWSTNAMFPLAA